MNTNEGDFSTNTNEQNSPLETREEDATVPNADDLAEIMKRYYPGEAAGQDVEPALAPLTLEQEQDREKALIAQFNRTHEFRLPHEVMQYTMINPDDRHEGDEGGDWVVFIGGFASIKETYKSEMLDLAKSGKRVLFLSPDKGAQPESEDTDYFNARSGADSGTLPGTIRAKAAAVSLLLEHLGVSHASVIGHSQGGAVAAAFSGMRPQVVERLLLDNPVGLIGEDTTVDLLQRVRAGAKQELSIAQSGADWWKQFRRISKFPLFRATKEIPGMAHTDIRPILRHMKQLKAQSGEGPEIILINSNNDQIYTKERVESGIGDDPLNTTFDRWLVYNDKLKGHGKVDRGDGKLFVQVMDDSPSRTSVIHQIVTEKP